MRIAYADPPYLGCCNLYGHFHGDDGRCWDEPETHRLLIERLCDEWPDGWALSMSAPSQRVLLPWFPPDSRTGIWVKPFAAFKRNVRVAYTWEPVEFWRGRASSKDGATPTRDFIAEPITMRKGFTGAKPEKVCRWILNVIGFKPGDTVDDLFPGTGVMGRVVESAQSELAYSFAAASSVVSPQESQDQPFSEKVG